jgi:glycosyltransferase involved in cell wall biosynthesis
LESFAAMKLKYRLPDDYFIISNSFLKHKNHIIVLEALALLKKQNKPVNLIFTGKMEVYPDQVHLDKLKKIIGENQLQDNVKLLGVIPRGDQLSIMVNARAVLQPSKFEGWNTTIEDAKSLQLPVIASDLEVHKEQLGEKGIYFNPDQAESLADVLSGFSGAASSQLYENYETRVKKFATDFLRIFQLQK